MRFDGSRTTIGSRIAAGCLAIASFPAFAQKAYDPGASDTEMMMRVSDARWDPIGSVLISEGNSR